MSTVGGGQRGVKPAEEKKFSPFTSTAGSGQSGDDKTGDDEPAEEMKPTHFNLLALLKVESPETASLRRRGRRGPQA
jgi:hypothetical protein